MMDALARQILGEIEGGDIEAIREDGKYRLLIDLKPVFELDSLPECGVTDDHGVRIISGTTDVASIQADRAEDAKDIADALRFCFLTYRKPVALMKMRKCEVLIEHYGADYPLKKLEV